MIKEWVRNALDQKDGNPEHQTQKSQNPYMAAEGNPRGVVGPLERGIDLRLDTHLGNVFN